MSYEKYARVISQALSYILHPMLLPLYLSLILIYGNTRFSFLPEQLKLYVILFVLIFTMILPAGAIVLMKTFNIIDSYALITKKDRILPLLFTALCYAVAMIVITSTLGIMILARLLFSASILLSILTIITRYWKISLHMAGISGGVALLYISAFIGLGNLNGWFYLSIMLMGMLGSARLYLGKHNIYQIGAGTLVGFIVVVSSMLF